MPTELKKWVHKKLLSISAVESFSISDDEPISHCSKVMFGFSSNLAWPSNGF